MGGMISGIGLSGLDREESKSNQLWVSREAVVSNSDVKKFGMSHFKHFHTMFLPEDLLRIIYISSLQCYSVLSTIAQVLRKMSLKILAF